MNPAERVQLDPSQSFACHGCGHCCQRSWNVFVEPLVEATIRSSAWYAQRVREGYQPLYWEGDALVAGRDRCGHCIFHLAEGGCGLHAELGGQQKPLGCQLFPYRGMRTPRGTFYALSFSCPSVVKEDRGDLEERRRELQHLLEIWPEGVVAPSEVRLTTDQTIPWDDYFALEPWLEQGFEAGRPALSLMRLASALSARATGSSGPAPGPPLDDAFLEQLIGLYAPALIAMLENETDHQARASYSQSLSQGQALPTSYLASGRPVVFDAQRSLPEWAQSAFERYYRQQLIGKTLVLPSMVARLAALALGSVLLAHYAEAHRQESDQPALSQESLIWAFQIVEGDAVSHSRAFIPFYRDLESTLLRLHQVEE